MKAGIIGLGHGSRVLIDAFKINGIEVVGIVGSNLSKTKKICKENNIQKAYENWESLVDDKKIKIIAIAVPPQHQIKIFKECLKNKKIVLCEKPLVTDFKKINYLPKKINNYFFVDYFFREHEAFQKFNYLIKKTKFKKENNINIIFNYQTYNNKKNITNWKSSSHKGGGIVNLFLSHIVDYLIWFFGKLSKIYCKIKIKNSNEISLECIFVFKSYMKANITINLNNPNKMHLIEYKTSNKVILLQNNGKDLGKKFKIKTKTKYEKVSYIHFKDQTLNFKGDSRILFTAKIIKRIKNNIYNKPNLKNIKRFYYNEYVLHCARQSIKKNKEIVL